MTDRINIDNSNTWTWDTFIKWEKSDNLNKRMLSFLNEWVYLQERGEKFIPSYDLIKLQSQTENKKLKSEIQSIISNEDGFIKFAIDNGDFKLNKDGTWIVEINEKNYGLYSKFLSTILEKQFWQKYLDTKMSDNLQILWYTFTIKTIVNITRKYISDIEFIYE